MNKAEKMIIAKFLEQIYFAVKQSVEMDLLQTKTILNTDLRGLNCEATILASRIDKRNIEISVDINGESIKHQCALKRNRLIDLKKDAGILENKVEDYLKNIIQQQEEELKTAILAVDSDEAVIIDKHCFLSRSWTTLTTFADEATLCVEKGIIKCLSALGNESLMSSYHQSNIDQAVKEWIGFKMVN